MSFDIESYKLGRKSTEKYIQAVKHLLTEGSVADKLAYAAPYICGQSVDLSGFELYAIIEWLERPEGPPPSATFEALRSMLRGCRGVVTDEELARLVEDSGEPGGEE